MINSKYYIGVHKTNNPYDGYLGSGLAIKRSIAKYGRNSFTKNILFIFEREDDAFLEEYNLLQLCIGDPMCYNLMEGGRGGFTKINSHRNLYPNPMTIDHYKQKNRASRRGNSTPERENRLREINRSNIKKAISSNIGRTKPEHSTFKTNQNKIIWQDREKMRDALSSYYLVTDPLGISYTTNRLGDFCRDNQLSQVMMNRSAVEGGRVITKGKCLGWKCTKI